MYSTVQYSIVEYSTVQYSTVYYSTVRYSTVQYCTVQYNIVQYNVFLDCTNCRGGKVDILIHMSSGLQDDRMSGVCPHL